MRCFVRSTRAMTLSTSAGLALSTGMAGASILNCANVAGGAASTAANWSPAQVPAAADTLTFNLNSIYTVTYSNVVPLSTAHTFKRGTVTLSLTSPHTASGNFRAGDVSGDSAIATITTGFVNAGSVTIGNASGSTGTIMVTDSDADLITTGSGDIIVASAGNGTLNVTGGGRVSSADDVIFGSASGNGTALVSGFGTTPLRFSTIATNGVDDDIVVGNSSGTVSKLAIKDNGFVSSSDDVQIGLVAGASGTIDVSGNGNTATTPPSPLLAPASSPYSAAEPSTSPAPSALATPHLVRELSAASLAAQSTPTQSSWTTTAGSSTFSTASSTSTAESSPPPTINSSLMPRHRCSRRACGSGSSTEPPAL